MLAYTAAYVMEWFGILLTWVLLVRMYRALAYPPRTGNLGRRRSLLTPP